MRAREAGGAGEVVDSERLEVARVGQVLGAKQMTDRRDEEHLDNLLIEPRGLEVEVALDSLQHVSSMIPSFRSVSRTACSASRSWRMTR